MLYYRPKPYGAAWCFLSQRVANLDRVNAVVGGYLLECLAAADRLHGEPGLEFGAVVGVCSGGLPIGGVVPPPHRVHDGA